MLEKFKAEVHMRIGQPVNIWLSDPTLNEISDASGYLRFQRGFMEFHIENDIVVVSIRDKIYGRNGEVHFRLISGFGFEQSEFPAKSVVL